MALSFPPPLFFFHLLLISLHHYQHHQCHYPFYLNGSLWLKNIFYISIYLSITEACEVGQACLTEAHKTHLKISEIICCSKWKKTSNPDVLLQPFPLPLRKLVPSQILPQTRESFRTCGKRGVKLCLMLIVITWLVPLKNAL